jgi:two-component system response regulator YesN
MDKVFLADDEEWIVENLKISVDWAKYGYEIAGTAGNGLEAFEKIRKIKPQLVFTDIRMAGMNGLELMKKVNEHMGDVQFVVISGFAEFAYAQKAIDHGALGYLLKPIDENEIVRLLVKRNDKKKTGELEDHFYEVLLSSGAPGDGRHSGIAGRLEAAGLDPANGGGIRVIASIGQDRFHLPAIPHKIIFQSGADRTVYFVQDNPLVPPENLLPHPLPDWVRGIGIGGVFSREEDIPNGIEEATIAAFHYFIRPSSRITFYASITDGGNVADGFFQEVQKQLAGENPPELEAVLRKTIALFSRNDMGIVHAFHLYNMLYFYLQSKTEYNPISQITSFERLVLRYGSVEKMIESLIAAIREMPSHAGSEAAPYILKNETAGSIIRYINENFASDISLTDIAERFQIHPGYVSQLLKREIGKNYLEYLTKLRMENACKLLTSTSLNINRIAEKSGYDDFLYFRKIFKKLKGQTPSEYREARRLPGRN